MSTESNEPITDREQTADHQQGQLEAEPLVSWSYLNKFVVQIEKRTGVVAELYANGRQQAPIEIIIEARDSDGVVVNLTKAQLDAIKLIEYDTNVAVSNVSNIHDARYVYDGLITQEDGVELEQDQELKSGFPEATPQSAMKYVHKNALSTNWIAAEIRSPTGAIFRTNTPNPPAGKFDSWVKLRGKQPITHGWESFAMVREDYTTDSTWDVDLYYIRFTSLDLRIVDSINYGWSGHDIPHYSWIKSGKQVHHVAYRADGPRWVMHKSCVAPDTYTAIRVNRRSGNATASRVTDRRPCGNFHFDACRMGYIDQFGNEGKVMIKGSSDGNTLHLRDPYGKDDDPSDAPTDD